MNENESQAVASNDQLGLLPGPAGIGYYVVLDSKIGKKYVYREADTYTADQMRAYAQAEVAAERKRRACADRGGAGGAKDWDRW